MAATDWDAYWRNAQSAAAHKEGGPQDAVLEAFWMQLFAQVFPGVPAPPQILDIACGNGAVARFAVAAAARLSQEFVPHISGIDASPTALQEMHKRNPQVCCIAADALAMPFSDRTFDLVTSQFGMEYAGSAVFAEALRVLGHGGVLAAVLHLKDGAIYRECATNLEAIDGVRQCELLQCFEGIFRAALAVQEARGGKELFRAADEKFSGSVAATERLMQSLGKGVADGMLMRLYTDLAQMYRRFATYEPSEVFAWLGLMANELDTYAGRMASMLQAALDAAEMEAALAQLRSHGCSIRVQDTLKMGPSLVPAAWVLVAEKPQA